MVITRADGSTVSFTEGLIAPTTNRPQNEALRRARAGMTGGGAWPDHLEPQLKANLTEIYGDETHASEVDFLAVLSEGKCTEIEGVHDVGSTLVLCIHIVDRVLKELEAKCARGEPVPAASARDVLIPTFGLVVADSHEQADDLLAIMRNLTKSTKIGLCLWHGTPDYKGRTFSGDDPANHIIVATLGMLNTKFVGRELDVSQLRVVGVDNAMTLLGDEGKFVWEFVPGMKKKQRVLKDNKHTDLGLIAIVKKVREADGTVQVILNSNHTKPSATAQRMINDLVRPDPVKLNNMYGISGEEVNLMSNTHTFHELSKDDSWVNLTIQFVMDFVSNYKAGRRLLIVIPTQGSVDFLYQQLMGCATADPGVTDDQFKRKVGYYHGGIDDGMTGLQSRGSKGLDAFKDAHSTLLVLLATPLISSIRVELATDVLVVSPPGHVYRDDCMIRAKRFDALIGRDGKPGRVGWMVDTCVTASGVQSDSLRLARYMKSRYESLNLPMPQSLSDCLSEHDEIK